MNLARTNYKSLNLEETPIFPILQGRKKERKRGRERKEGQREKRKEREKAGLG